MQFLTTSNHQCSSAGQMMSEFSSIVYRIEALLSSFTPKQLAFQSDLLHKGIGSQIRRSHLKKIY